MRNSKTKVFIVVNKWEDGRKAIFVYNEDTYDMINELSYNRTIKDTISVIGQHKDYSYSGRKATWILDEWNNILNS